MNLNALDIPVMVAHSAVWLGTPRILKELQANDLCAAVIKRVKTAHEGLSALSARRGQAKKRIKQLKKLSKQSDIRHDRKARGVDAVVYGISQGTEDPELAELCLELHAILFPIGVSITQRSYLYQAGAVVAMKDRIKPEHLKLMGKIKIGPSETLLEWYQHWVEAGEKLGGEVHERMALEKHSSRTGSGGADVDGTVARNAWIAAAQKLIDAVLDEPIAEDIRDAIIGPLEKSIQAALTGKPDPIVGDDEGGEEEGEEDGSEDGEDEGSETSSLASDGEDEGADTDDDIQGEGADQDGR